MVENLKISISKGKKDENMYVRSLDIFFFLSPYSSSLRGKKIYAFRKLYRNSDLRLFNNERGSVEILEFSYIIEGNMCFAYTGIYVFRKLHRNSGF